MTPAPTPTDRDRELANELVKTVFSGGAMAGLDAIAAALAQARSEGFDAGKKIAITKVERRPFVIDDQEPQR